jgi:hypothetical protein
MLHYIKAKCNSDKNGNQIQRTNMRRIMQLL